MRVRRMCVFSFRRTLARMCLGTRDSFSSPCEGGGDLCRRRYQADVHHQTTQHREKEFFNYATARCSESATNRSDTEVDDGGEKYRHLVNTCTSQAGPLRVKGKPVPLLRLHSLSLSFSSTSDAYRYDSAEYTTRVHGHVQHAACSLFISFVARSFHLPSENAACPRCRSSPLLFTTLRFR